MIFIQLKIHIKTGEDAIKGLNDFVQEAIKIFSEEVPELNINPANYYDMKTSETKAWDKSDEALIHEKKRFYKTIFA